MKLEYLGTVATFFVFIGLVLGIGIKVLNSVKGLVDTTESINKMASWLPLIAIIMVAALVIGIFMSLILRNGRDYEEFDYDDNDNYYPLKEKIQDEIKSSYLKTEWPKNKIKPRDRK